MSSRAVTPRAANLAKAFEKSDGSAASFIGNKPHANDAVAADSATRGHCSVRSGEAAEQVPVSGAMTIQQSSTRARLWLAAPNSGCHPALAPVPQDRRGRDERSRDLSTPSSRNRPTHFHL